MCIRDSIKPIMPQLGDKSYFKNFHKKIEYPYVIYMDFESTLYKLDTCACNPDKTFTIKTLVHKPYSSLYI